MNTIVRKSLIFFSLLIIPFISSAQEWLQKMQTMDENFYSIQQSFEKYAEGRDPKQIPGFKPYKRWENFWKSRVYPTGEFPDNTELWRLISSKERSVAPTANSWSLLGPVEVPLKSNGQKRGIGRINVVRFHPTDSNIIWVGTPAGGLWKSTDNGMTWSTLSDQLTNLGVSDLLIHPTNPDTMWLATGDGDAGDTYSYGVLKTIDGGLTWNPTGLLFTVSTRNRISRLIMDHSNPNIMFAATTNGVYRTTNGGTSWNRTLTMNMRDIEMHPTDSSIVYASTYDYSGGLSRFYKSTTNGASWTQITATLPTTGVVRSAISVSPAAPDNVYVLYTNSTFGYKGLYVSTDKGSTFTAASTTPNILANDEYGTGSSGQGWYDLALAVSPVDPDLIFVGGVNIWKSTNGGSTWSISAHWTGGSGGTLPYVHADQHALEFKPGSNVLFSGNDGGIAKTLNAGTSWTDISDGISVTQFYRLGLSAQTPHLMLAGAQDNGTLKRKNAVWSSAVMGDGMEAAINPLDSNNMYGSMYYGAIYRTTNGGTNWSQVAGNNVNGINEQGDWVTPYVIDPTDPNILYAGFSKVWKSTNKGSAWTAISSVLDANYKITALAVSRSNPDVIYAGSMAKLYKTVDGGANWTNISTGLPLSSAGLTYLAIDPVNPDHIYVTLSGYTSTAKVYESVNGGTNWTNLSSGLPNLPVNCIVYEDNTNDAIYVGTDVGVYYRNDTMGWTAFKVDLPNVIVNELEIHYGTGKIRAATYGRGVWEANLYRGNPVSIADLNSSSVNLYPNPASHQLTITLPSSEAFDVKIFNALGELVYEKSKAASGLSIDLGNFSNGGYIVKLYNKSSEISKKLIVLKPE